MELPNIVYIHSHDVGRYVQPYGHAVDTPNIQALAEEGVLFRQAFCAGPTCSPSRAALLTGQSPHSSGMLGLAHRGFSLNDYHQHIVHTLAEAGYTSALSGFQHLARLPFASPSHIGYDQIICHNLDSASVTQSACKYLRTPPTKPFFLSAGFVETHRPFTSEEPADDPRYTLPPAGIPDTPETRQDMADFKTPARQFDRSLGEIVKAIDKAGIAKQTLIICTTDHGLAFPGMKCTLTDQGIGVMLIMRGPGGFSGGKVIDAMVSQIDVFPTICNLLDIDPPSWLQGNSILPLITGKAKSIDEEVFAEITYHAAYDPQRAVRTSRWKYIKRFDDRRKPLMVNCDDGPSKDVWMEAGWQGHTVDKEQLYDLLFDPGEGRNLADNPAFHAQLLDMRGRLDSWMRKTNDPLLEGPVAPPPGATVNAPDATSANEPPEILQ